MDKAQRQAEIIGHQARRIRHQRAQLRELQPRDRLVMHHQWLAHLVRVSKYVNNLHWLWRTAETRAERAEAEVARLREALTSLLDEAPERLTCSRHCVLEIEVKEEEHYVSVLRAARAALQPAEDT